ncbi:hypothetical protein HY625_00255 [Candidatus Uhrbacteria bacterium]|nr:hypothetical protein [Candidatus Uhrbacteria bacterium]
MVRTIPEHCALAGSIVDFWRDIAMSDYELIRELQALIPAGWMPTLRVIGIIWGVGLICFIFLITAAHYRDRFPRLFGWVVGEIQPMKEDEKRRDQ